MFERETKREKILEARHREMRLKERARSEGKEEEAKEDGPSESPEELLARAQKEFFEIIDAERRRREQGSAKGPTTQVAPGCWAPFALS